MKLKIFINVYIKIEFKSIVPVVAGMFKTRILAPRKAFSRIVKLRIETWRKTRDLLKISIFFILVILIRVFFTLKFTSSRFGIRNDLSQFGVDKLELAG